MSNTCVDPVTLEFIQLVLAKIAIKMSECQTKAGNQECLAKLAKLSLSISHSLTLDMLNNFCFHVYAQKSVFIGQNVNAFF